MRLLFCMLICLVQLAAGAAESWQDVLSRMPLGANVTQLNRTNCVKIMLSAFQSNDVVKALIFMPGATDEFYMFRRAKATLTNDSPTLLDAVNALTNQTLIKATFRPPMLLLHTDEDPLELLIEIKDPVTVGRLESKRFVPHALYNDRDWDFLQPILQKKFGIWLLPRSNSRDSFHFYRHSFAAWNLDGWQALQAIAFAGKTKFTVKRRLVVFEGDARILAVPKIDHFPE
ncbi:MAG: hypothetical protein JWQ04_2658 [Pedosphaera sp.]|nr:hypothetical protein [Pedosphaera sp.]